MEKILFGSIYFFILIGLCVVIFKEKRIREIIIKNKYKILAFILINVVLISLISYFHLSKESFIPSWDFGGFYRRALEFTDKLDFSLQDAAKSLYESINIDEYNYVAEWYLYLPMKILGNSYLRFIICMINVFLIPSNTLLYILYLKISEEFKNKWLDIVVGIFIIFFSANIYPLIHGYIGSSGLFYIVFILLFVYLGKFNKVNIPFSILTGVLLLILLVTRRWYAYWIVGFFVATVVATIAIKDNWKNLKSIIINCFISGFVALSLLLIFFFPLFQTITTYNYSEAYSVMKVTGISEIIINFIKVYGVVNVVLMGVGIFASVKFKYLRSFVIFLVIQIVVSIVLFNQVQRFGSHHYYIINSMCILLIIIGILFVTELLSKKLRLFIMIPMIILLVINSLQTTVLSNKKFEPLFTVTNWMYGRMYPVVRITENKEGIIDLINYINANIKEFDYTYTIASSVEFNEDHLRNALLPNDLVGLHNLMTTRVYDLRDYLPNNFFYNRYVIVTDPVQLQFDESQQRVISVLGDFMLNYPNIDKYYRLVKEIKINNDFNVKLFERIDNVPNSVRQEISDILKSYYPNEPKMYEFEMLPE